jgi:putative hydrolase of the HAD superfamily
MPGPLKAVFFDAGGTLLAPNPSFHEIYARVLAPVGVRSGPEELRRAALATWGEFDMAIGRGTDRYSHFPGGEREYWRRFVRRVLERVEEADKADAAAEALQAAFSDPGVWAVFPEVMATVRALKARGLRVGVISNWDSRLRRILDAHALSSQFEAIVVSCEVGSEKPAPAIFERALRQLDLAPGEALHVGDDLVSDYEGSRGAGMRGVLLVRHGEPPGGVTAVATLDGLLPLVDREGAS